MPTKDTFDLARKMGLLVQVPSKWKPDQSDKSTDRKRGGRLKREDGGGVLGDGRFQRVDPKTYKRTPTGTVGNLPSGTYKSIGDDLYRDLKAKPIEGMAPPDLGRSSSRDRPDPVGPYSGGPPVGPDHKRGGRLTAARRMGKR